MLSLPLFNMWLVFFVHKKLCTHKLVEDVRRVGGGGGNIFLDTLHSRLGTPAHKISACMGGGLGF